MNPTSEPLIRVQGVSKKFCRSLKRSLWYGLCDIAGELSLFGRRDIAGGRSSVIADEAQSSISRIPCSFELSVGDKDLRDGEFWAVNDVSFELRRGECIGLIGRNGAGKTTLLKMLNGLIKPDTGRIEMNGRVGALIALGAGFNPILTGRENIYINGSVLGLPKKEIEEKIEEIIDFAEIRDFIDMPVQNYSSGMQVRLGFAVATTLDPDVLILDEVLAVGDASFRHKCYNKIQTLIQNAAVIFVSHSMEQIAQICTSVLSMNCGRGKYFSEPTDGVNEYFELTTDVDVATADGGSIRVTYPPITAFEVHLSPAVTNYGEELVVTIELLSSDSVDDVEVAFSANDNTERTVLDWSLSRSQKSHGLSPGKTEIRFAIKPLLLHGGLYRWNLWVGRKGSVAPLVYAMRAGVFRVENIFGPRAQIPYLLLPEDYSVKKVSG